MAFSRCLIHILPVTVSLVPCCCDSIAEGIYVGRWGLSSSVLRREISRSKGNGRSTRRRRRRRKGLNYIGRFSWPQAMVVIIIFLSVTRGRLFHGVIPFGFLLQSGLFFLATASGRPAPQGAISAIVTPSKFHVVCFLLSLVTLGTLWR